MARKPWLLQMMVPQVQIRGKYMAFSPSSSLLTMSSMVLHMQSMQKNSVMQFAIASGRKSNHIFYSVNKNSKIHAVLGVNTKKIKALFGSTGAGVMPAEGTSAKNLLGEFLVKCSHCRLIDC
jgi:hypothetical protein